FLGQGAGHDIRAAAGRVGHDPFNGAGRVVGSLRLERASGQQQRRRGLQVTVHGLSLRVVGTAFLVMGTAFLVGVLTMGTTDKGTTNAGSIRLLWRVRPARSRPAPARLPLAG